MIYKILNFNNLKDKEKENKMPNIINIHKEIDLIDLIIPTKEEVEKKEE